MLAIWIELDVLYAENWYQALVQELVQEVLEALAASGIGPTDDIDWNATRVIVFHVVKS